MVKFHGVREAETYFILLFVRLGGFALGGAAAAVGALSPRLRPICIAIFLASFAVVLFVSVVSIVASALRKERYTTWSERLGFYFSLEELDQTAQMVGAEPSRARRWIRVSIVIAVAGVVVAAASSAFARG